MAKAKAGSISSIPAHPNPQKKKSLKFCNLKLLISMAGPMGLEPTASGVTGRRYNRLNYDPAWSSWWAVQGSNL